MMRAHAATLANQIQAAQARFEAAVAGLAPQRLEMEPAVGTWSPRTVAAHLADWAEEMLAASEVVLDRPVPPHHPIPDGQAYNSERAAEHAGRSWQVVSERLDAVVARAVALAERLTPEQLATAVTAPWGGSITVAALLHDIAAHHDEHSAQLEAWRAGT